MLSQEKDSTFIRGSTFSNWKCERSNTLPFKLHIESRPHRAPGMDEPRADLYLVEYFLVAVLVTLRPQLGMKALATSLYTASKGIRTTLGSFAVHRRQAQQA